LHFYSDYKDYDHTLHQKDRPHRKCLGLTHGNGIDYANDQLLEFISSGDVSLIWSPVSNLLLYQDTHDIRKLLDSISRNSRHRKAPAWQQEARHSQHFLIPWL
jgi:hypothetical protein